MTTIRKDIISTSCAFAIAFSLALSSFIVYQAEKNKTTAFIVPNSCYSSIKSPLSLTKILAEELDCSTSDLELENSSEVSVNKDGVVDSLSFSLYGKDKKEENFSSEIQMQDDGDFWLSKTMTSSKNKGPSFENALECVSLWNFEGVADGSQFRFTLDIVKYQNPEYLSGNFSYVFKDHILEKMESNLHGEFYSVVVFPTRGSISTIYY